MTPPNVIVLVLDTARAHDVSCYGYDRETTPNLDDIAAESIRFENAIANAPWTLPSHASMFTGRLPFAHGAHARGYQLSEEVPTLAERLRTRGYDTTIVSNNGWLSDGFGVLRGFENRYELWKLFQTDTDIVEPYRRYVKHTDLRESPGSVLRFATTVLTEGNVLKDSVNLLYGAFHRDEIHHSGERITRIVENHIRDTEDPFFLVANYLEPHLKYAPPEPYRSRFLPENATESRVEDVCQDVYEVQFGDTRLTDRDRTLLRGLYDGEIAHCDQYVGEVYDFLRAEGHLEDTLLVVVGDHGENVGDHGLLGHNSSLHDTVLRVPMVVRPPGGTSGTVESALVQPSDLYRTVLAAAGVSADDGDDTFSYDILSDVDARPPEAVAQYAGLQLQRERISEEFPDVDVDAYDRRLVSIHHGGHKLVRSDTGEETVLRTDGLRTEAVSDPDRRTVRRLSERLSTYGTEVTDSAESNRTVSAAIEGRLKDLGYHR